MLPDRIISPWFDIMQLVNRHVLKVDVNTALRVFYHRIAHLHITNTSSHQPHQCSADFWRWRLNRSNSRNRSNRQQINKRVSFRWYRTHYKQCEPVKIWSLFLIIITAVKSLFNVICFLLTTAQSCPRWDFLGTFQQFWSDALPHANNNSHACQQVKNLILWLKVQHLNH